MKLESLKSSKFEAFKGNEVVNLFAIKGGLRTATTWHESGNPGNNGTDTWCTGPDESAHIEVFDEMGDMIWSAPVNPDVPEEEWHNYVTLERIEG